MFRYESFFSKNIETVFTDCRFRFPSCDAMKSYPVSSSVQDYN